jgi:L-amino acid N-acyltransferase YncA
VSDIALRPFHWGDVPQITAIYRHYVEHSTATFDLEAPGPTAMAEKFGHMVEAGHPVLVAQRGDEIVGYAYASVYRPRPAYRFTCEDSIYLKPEATGLGLGKRMLGELITAAQAFGFRQMIAVITAESAASVALHERAGFVLVGRHENTGIKFDRWLDVIHMQRAL